MPVSGNPRLPLSVARITSAHSASSEPRGVTVLCAELPCSTTDTEWSLPDDELGELVKDCLDRAGLPVTAKVREVASRRLAQAYPIYTQGYERHFNTLDAWADDLPGVLTFGRQGLFAHDNTHHALAMANGAVDCLDPTGTFDHVKWQRYRKQFESHVVED